MRLEKLKVTITEQMCADGKGFALMMEAVLPWFQVGSSAVALGISRAATEGIRRHLLAAKLEHLGQPLASLPTLRARLAQMQIAVDTQDAHLAHIAADMVCPGPNTMLGLLECKASAASGLQITDQAMHRRAPFSRAPHSRCNFVMPVPPIMAPHHGCSPDFIGRLLRHASFKSYLWLTYYPWCRVYDSRVSPFGKEWRLFPVGRPGHRLRALLKLRQSLQLFARHIDIAWNTNWAWVKAYHFTNGTCQASMPMLTHRLTTVIVARADSGIDSLRSRSVYASGSADRPRHILPVHYLQEAGVARNPHARSFRLISVSMAIRVQRARSAASPWEDRTPAGREHLAALVGEAHRCTPIPGHLRSPGHCHCVFTASANFPGTSRTLGPVAACHAR